MKRGKKLLKEIDTKDFDLFQKFYFLFELAFNHSDLEKEEIKYTKKFFTRYYCVDAETLSKWIKIFCPNLVGIYKTKRIFNEEEVAYIFEKLGSLPYKQEALSERKEVMKGIYKDKKWKKSRQYEEFKMELLEKFPNEKIRLNKLPPKIILSVVKEEIEELSEISTLNRDISQEKRVASIFRFLDEYEKISRHSWEVKRRWFVGS